MATLLDELLIKIKADTAGAERGLERTEQKSEKLSTSFAGLAARALGAFASIAAAGQAISGAIGRAADIEALDRTAQALGVGVTELDAFGKAAERMGGDAQGARDSLTDMAESIGEALQDVESGRAKTFAALGISLRGVNGQAKDAITGMMDLADAVQGLSREEAIFRIKELGITDNRTVEMVLKGRTELERMIRVQKENGAVTREQAERARGLNEAMNAFRMGVTSGANSLFDWLIPAIKTSVEWLTKIVNWANQNKTVVAGFFAAIAAVVAAVYLPAMISAAAATLAATWPILAIIAAVVAAAAAFALLYDDVMNFVQGNDSFIGQVFEKYPIIKDIVFAVVDAFKFMMDFSGKLFDYMVAGTSSMIEGFVAFKDGVVAVFEFIGKAWKVQMDFILKGVQMVKDGLRSVADFFGFGGDEGVDAAGAQLSAAQQSPLNGTTSAAISNAASGSSETNVPIGQITINTQATDAAGISRDLNSELQGQLRDLDAQTATGVAR